jgi:hypothetical protein
MVKNFAIAYKYLCLKISLRQSRSIFFIVGIGLGWVVSHLLYVGSHPRVDDWCIYSRNLQAYNNTIGLLSTQSALSICTVYVLTINKPIFICSEIRNQNGLVWHYLSKWFWTCS